jgi:hypothetical protein
MSGACVEVTVGGQGAVIVQAAQGRECGTTIHTPGVTCRTGMADRRSADVERRPTLRLLATVDTVARLVGGIRGGTG